MNTNRTPYTATAVIATHQELAAPLQLSDKEVADLKIALLLVACTGKSFNKIAKLQKRVNEHFHTMFYNYFFVTPEEVRAKFNPCSADFNEISMRELLNSRIRNNFSINDMMFLQSNNPAIVSKDQLFDKCKMEALKQSAYLAKMHSEQGLVIYKSNPFVDGSIHIIVTHVGTVTHGQVRFVIQRGPLFHYDVKVHKDEK